MNGLLLLLLFLALFSIIIITDFMSEFFTWGLFLAATASHALPGHPPTHTHIHTHIQTHTHTHTHTRTHTHNTRKGLTAN